MAEIKLVPVDGVPYVDYLPDNSAEVLDNIPALQRRCVACPFTADTEASQDATTSRIARECVEARCSFFCHLTSDGEVCSHLCAGWVSAIGEASNVQ